MSQTAPDDLDALLASLLTGTEQDAEPTPDVVALPLPKLSAEEARVFVSLREWLDEGAPGGTWQPPQLDPPTPEPEALEPEILLELAAAQAWRAGDEVAFELALAKLPADRSEHHRRMAGVCDLIKARQAERARLKGEDRDRTSPTASVGSP